MILTHYPGFNLQRHSHTTNNFKENSLHFFYIQRVQRLRVAPYDFAFRSEVSFPVNLDRT